MSYLLESDVKWQSLLLLYCIILTAGLLQEVQSDAPNASSDLHGKEFSSFNGGSSGTL